MKRFVIRIVWALVALTVVFMGGAYVLPDEAVVERHIDIAAPIGTVWPLVSDLRNFNRFSPWADLNSETHYSFEGPATGTGQKMTWSSANAEVGAGSQTITAMTDQKRVETELDFGGMGKASVAFDLAPADTGTHVIWRFSSPLNNPLERWLGLLYDRWIGADYERGLTRLKTVAETP
ncbi:hypothetical protein BH10PSE7_BH10PSE7_37370 [soil metagenome]